MTDNVIYVKELLPDGKSPHQGYPWPLPVQGAAGEWTPGEWVEADANQPLVECGNGLHAYTEEQVQPNLRHDRAYWVIEYAEPPRDWGGKVSGYRARLLRPYPLPGWLLSAQPAIDALRNIPWLKPDGNPDPSWRLFPTRDAAWDAAWDAAGDVARDVARDVAGDVAGDVARAAAWDAAGDAARDVARDAARDVARDVAGDVAGDAARDAARDVARDVAGDVAGDAAGDAAWDAARDAALYIRMTIVCADLSIAQEHRDHVEARMNAWRKGYGLLCDVGGTLYVYERVK